MPKPVAAPVVKDLPVAPPPKPIDEPERPARPIIYPTLEVRIYDKDHLGPLTASKMETLLGWETEEDYKKRVGDGAAAGYGEEYLLKDEYGKKVRCWNNDTNRPFDETHGRKLAQDVLARNWAGPTTMPGETVNGETMIISRTGRTESGQHRGIGLILAKQIWEKQQRAYADTWPTEPVLESIVVFGVSESPRVIQTLDNVKPRALSDVLFTSSTFQGMGLSNTERRECSRMMDSAIDLMWKRTRAAEADFQKYQTHSSSMDFLERHPRLKECIKHLFTENKDRGISKLKLSAGQCSAMMYLMAASATDLDTYTQHRDEKRMNWEYWERAEEFWRLLGDQKKNELLDVRRALGRLIDADQGLGGRLTEKLGVISKAWLVFRDGSLPKSDPETDKANDDLKLDYEVDEATMESVLINQGDLIVGGIDQGMPFREDPPEPTAEEIAAKEAEEKAKREAKAKAKEAKIAASKTNISGKAVGAMLTDLREKYPGRVVLSKGTGVYNAWQEDATFLKVPLGLKTVPHQEGFPRLVFPEDQLERVVKLCTTAGKTPVIVHAKGDGGYEVVDVQERKEPVKATTPVKQSQTSAKQQPVKTPVKAAAKQPTKVVPGPKGKPPLKGGTNR